MPPPVEHVHHETAAASSRQARAFPLFAHNDAITETWSAATSSITSTNIADAKDSIEKATTCTSEQDVFPALPTTEKNCHDLFLLFEKEAWRNESELADGAHFLRSWDDMKKTLGQFSFHCVSLRLTDLHEISQPGGVLNLFAYTHAVQSFIRHYTYCSIMPCGSDTELFGKLVDLHTAAKTAEAFEAENSSGWEMQLAYYMQTLTCIEHVLADVRTRVFSESPEKQIAYLDAEHFTSMTGALTTRCKSLMNRWNFADTSDITFLRLWASSFLTLLIITAPGYKTDLYTYLVVPSMEELSQWCHCAKTGDLYKIRLQVKGYPDFAALSSLVFPRRLLRFIHFHVCTFLPVLQQHHLLHTTPLDHHRYMLLSPASFDKCTELELHSIVLRYIANEHPDFTAVTFPQLRASYGYVVCNSWFQERNLTQSEKSALYAGFGLVYNTSPTTIAQLAHETADTSQRTAVWKFLTMIRTTEE